jgi:hypothetical protein
LELFKEANTDFPCQIVALTLHPHKPPSRAFCLLERGHNKYCKLPFAWAVCQRIIKGKQKCTKKAFDSLLIAALSYRACVEETNAADYKKQQAMQIISKILNIYIRFIGL